MSEETRIKCPECGDSLLYVNDAECFVCGWGKNFLLERAKLINENELLKKYLEETAISKIGDTSSCRICGGFSKSSSIPKHSPQCIVVKKTEYEKIEGEN
jgi:ribosomal protein L37E